MSEQTNPFKRLHDGLSVVVDYANRNGISTSNSAQDVWMAALGLEETGVYKEQFNLLLVVNECEQLIRRIHGIDQERYLARIEKVKSGILSVGSSRWGSFRSMLNDDFLDALYATSEAVSLLVGEEVIPEEVLISLQENVEDIINRVVDSDLEDELKSVLFNGLEAVRQALLNYQISGAEGIRQALDRNVGLIHRYGEEFKRAGEQRQGKEVFSDFFDLLKRMDTLVSIGLRIQQLGEPAALMLSSGV